MRTTSVFNRNLEAYNEGYRVIVNKGSTSSSKTWSLLQLLYIIASLSGKQKQISIVSESMPHLKRGCLKDFKQMLLLEGKWNQDNWHDTDKIYRINNSTIEFFSVDQASKVHGPRRDILYCNEAINIKWETYRQLAIRTRETIFMDLNPNFEFWADEKVLPREDSCLIHSTYKDNEFLTKAQIDEIESNKHDSEWWKVYGEGKTGSKVGLVIQNWDIVEAMPVNLKKEWIGLDFGFTNDPTAAVSVGLSEGDLWIDELLFEKGLDNTMIAKFLQDKKSVQIIADSAEPKSISEIKSFGYTIEGALKGKDSISNGISILNRYKKHVTKRSLNVIKEYRNYRWKTDEFGNPTNTPIDLFNHSTDAQRYVALNCLSEKPKSRGIRKARYK